MNEITFDCEIYYSQLSVCKYGMKNPFNDWTDIHVKQGFAWREGSVSFSTISEDADCKIHVSVMNNIHIDNEVIRAIVVPFKVGAEGVEIGSIMKTTAIELTKGVYELLFTCKIVDGVEEYGFTFIKSDNPKPRVIVEDEGLKVPKELFMKANPAI